MEPVIRLDSFLEQVDASVNPPGINFVDRRAGARALHEGGGPGEAQEILIVLPAPLSPVHQPGVGFFVTKLSSQTHLVAR